MCENGSCGFERFGRRSGELLDGEMDFHRFLIRISFFSDQENNPGGVLFGVLGRGVGGHERARNFWACKERVFLVV
mgnify:CR=1 FL=1